MSPITATPKTGRGMLWAGVRSGRCAACLLLNWARRRRCAPHREAGFAALRAQGLADCSYVIGHLNGRDTIEIWRDAKKIFSAPRIDLQRAWSEAICRIARLRGHPACADEEYGALLDARDPGLTVHLSFNPEEDIAAPFVASGARPRIAILREQGVNSHLEAAYAFD